MLTNGYSAGSTFVNIRPFITDLILQRADAAKLCILWNRCLVWTICKLEVDVAREALKEKPETKN